MDVRFLSHSLLLILTSLFILPPAKPVPDYSALIYKTCASQAFAHGLSQSYSQTLTSLFQQFIAQSSQSKFFKTMEIGNQDTAISGLFQCREDISGEDCFGCVKMLPQMSSTLCSDSVAARVQLEGCYTQYHAEGLAESTGEGQTGNLLHKDCGEPTVAYAKFRDLMEAAFAALESGVLKSNGFYTANYESVQLVAQCEGDLDACDCSECVNEAVQVAEEQCGSSLSAQIYLAKCFMSYIYHPESDGRSAGNFPGGNNSSSTQKLAAIIVGGAAVVCVGYIFLLFLKSRYRKGDYE